MPWGRVLSTCVASLAVAGCAAVVVSMSNHVARNAAAPVRPHAPSPAWTARPAYLPAPTSTAPTKHIRRVARTEARRAHPTRAITSRVRPAPVRHASTAAAAAPTSSASSPPAPSPPRPRVSPTTRPSVAPRVVPSTTHPASTRSPHPAPARRPRGRSLPLHYRTGSATRVITVKAGSRGRTTATLQAWTKAAGGGWRRHGSSVTAHIGAQGMSAHPSESKSATPMGSFTLTRAFGHHTDPGTRLPYIHTRPSDWWISQPGRYYNTHQRCSSRCGFTRGSPNEHLYYEMPYYRYAVVIDTPFGSRAYPHGSAFFLHVHPPGTGPTAGCVAIPQAKLVGLMRWLTPSAHPRILIGTS